MIAGVAVVALAVLCAWYAVAADYGYGMVAGTYFYRHAGESSTLVLKKDRTFIQERVRNSKVELARGEWRRSGEGGISFSEGFLEVANIHAESDHETHGQVMKHFLSLIPYIVLGQDWDNGPKFRRHFFHLRDLEKP